MWVELTLQQKFIGRANLYSCRFLENYYYIYKKDLKIGKDGRPGELAFASIVEYIEGSVLTIDHLYFFLLETFLSQKPNIAYIDIIDRNYNLGPSSSVSESNIYIPFEKGWEKNEKKRILSLHCVFLVTSLSLNCRQKQGCFSYYVFLSFWNFLVRRNFWDFLYFLSKKLKYKRSKKLKKSKKLIRGIWEIVREDEKQRKKMNLYCFILFLTKSHQLWRALAGTLNCFSSLSLFTIQIRVNVSRK